MRENVARLSQFLVIRKMFGGFGLELFVRLMGENSKDLIARIGKLCSEAANLKVLKNTSCLLTFCWMLLVFHIVFESDVRWCGISLDGGCRIG